MRQLLNVMRSCYKTARLKKESSETLKKRRLYLWQELQKTLLKTPALSHLAGLQLSDLPILSPIQIRQDITKWNSLGIDHKEAFDAAKNAEEGGSGEIFPGVTSGFSTGTSGNRGVFITTQEERSIYLGQNIAKLLSFRSIFSGIKIMLFLRANNRLYSDSGRSVLFQYQYCSLALTTDEKIKAIEKFKPNILIAPSHTLLDLAINGLNHLNLKHCFYGAEPMGDHERDWIKSRIGVRPDPIYQATEGFLGFPCAFGKLHLNEDSLEIELEAIEGTNGYQIIATDLLRKTQPIVRVKLDDFIELDQTLCKCGFAGRTILPICGRVQDLWRFHNNIITPRQVINILEQTLGAACKWQAIASDSGVTLLVEANTPHELVQNSAAKLTTSLGLKCPIKIGTLGGDVITIKRQRIKWENGNE